MGCGICWRSRNFVGNQLTRLVFGQDSRIICPLQQNNSSLDSHATDFASRCMLDGLEVEDDDEFYDPDQDRYDSENGDSDKFMISSEDESDSDGVEIVTEEVETRIDANNMDYDGKFSP